MVQLLLHTRAEVLRQALVDMGVVSAPESLPWPAFVDNDNVSSADIDNLISINNTGGREFGYTQIDGERQEMPGVQIQAISNNPAASAKILAVIAASLNDYSIYPIEVYADGVGYLLEDFVRTSDILFAGMVSRNDRRRLHTINAVVSYSSIETNLATFLQGGFNFLASGGTVIYGQASGGNTIPGTLVGTVVWGSENGNNFVRLPSQAVSATTPSYLDLGTPTQLNGTKGFTIFLKVRFEPTVLETPVRNLMLFDVQGIRLYADAGSDVVTEPGESVTITGLVFQIVAQNGVDYIRRSCPGGIRITSGSIWHTVAVTYSANGKPTGMKIYFDGVRKDSTSDSSVSSLTMKVPTQHLKVGQDFYGDIGALQIYDKALDAQTIAGLHANAMT